MQTNNDNLKMIIFIFDSGMIDDSFYGNIVFEEIIKGTEISRNSHKIVFSFGDILDKNIYEDISPYIINDEFCTIAGTKSYHGDLYAVLVEDIESTIAIELDTRLKNEFSAYIGMSTINRNSSDIRKQFWKALIRSLSIKGRVITSFGNNEEYDSFPYNKEMALNFGYIIDCDGIDSMSCDEDGEMYHTRQSSFIKSEKQLEGQRHDRGKIEMSTALAKEAQVAGVMIWKAIEDINLVRIPHQKEIFGEYVISDYVFTSLYQASQGIERLLKIAIQLMMYNNGDNSERALSERLLYSHNHHAMIDFILKRVDFELKSSCKNFVKILSDFYTNARYSRFTSNSDDKLELTLLRNLGKGLDVEDFDNKIKHRYGKFLGETTQALFSLIRELSSELNIWVHEISSVTSAYFVLYSEENVDLFQKFKNVETAKRELLWYLMSEGISPKLKKHIENYKPLEFKECYNQKELMGFLIDNRYIHFLFDFVSEEYNELVAENKDSWKQRLEIVDFITRKYDYTFYDDDDME